MSRLILALLALGISLVEGRVVKVAGDVSRGQPFRADIGDGLVFALVPVDNGWHIAVQPQTPPSDAACKDYVWVVTPPYRFDNQRYLDTSYGKTAPEAVNNTPREFSFVLNCADYKRAAAWVDSVLWPSGASQKKSEERVSVPTGKGRLRILEHNLGRADEAVGGVNLGRIDWLKFEADLEIPAATRPNR